MNKILTVALGAALAVASASAAAADANGAFFINGGVGQAQYHVGHTDGLGYKLDDKDTAGALRFGYAWHLGSRFDLGVEGGYADLGKLVANYYAVSPDGTYVEHEHADLGASAWLAGANGKFNFADKWYVSARAGWLHATVDAHYSHSATGYVTQYASGDVNGNGWYGGVGVGYDFAPNFSLGLNYDNYHVKGKTVAGSFDGNAGAYMVTAEFRF